MLSVLKTLLPYSILLFEWDGYKNNNYLSIGTPLKSVNPFTDKVEYYFYCNTQEYFIQYLSEEKNLFTFIVPSQ